MRSDEELAAAAQRGDRGAAQELLSRYQDRLFGLALRLLRNREDAADVVQEAMVKTLQSLDRYDPGRPFSPWIYRITRNLCIDRHRGRARRPTDELDERTMAGPSFDEGGSRAFRAPDVVAHQREVNAALERAMAGLGDKYREIIRLYHYEHLTYPQIAELLQLPDGTVMNRLFRARRKLQAAMTEMGVVP